MDGERTRACTGSKPVADDFPFEPERTACMALVVGPAPLGDQRTVRHAHGWQIEDRAEVNGQTGSPGMVASGRIDEQNLRRSGEPADCGGEQRSFPQRE
jgi:hypothetical protein